jgi:pimeloyl-ACP methyl ester carboxylesterase
MGFAYLTLGEGKIARASVRSMTTFVLVHGAWGGSWGFRLVRRPLREAGHEVFTPSLTDIVLLGFSYGGMVVTGALDHVADRVSHLVYLDAFRPADGQSLDDLAGAGYRQAAVGPGASWTAADDAKASQDWRYHEVDSDHVIPLSRPDDLVAILLGLT